MDTIGNQMVMLNNYHGTQGFKLKSTDIPHIFM